jgi:hypothetical protein
MTPVEHMADLQYRDACEFAMGRKVWEMTA